MFETKKRISGLIIKEVRATALRPHLNNARTHSAKQIDLIVRSIKDYGWTNPILVDEELNVLAGHGRLEAAKKLGILDVPTICLSHMSKAQKRAYIIADNRLSETAGSWDRKLLALEHEAIMLEDPEFDLSATGFELDEIEIMLDTRTDCTEGKVPEPDLSKPPVSRIGDLWVLGQHRIICGDALEPSVYEALLGGELAQMVIADCPYNCTIDGNVVGKGKHREFVMASGEMTSKEFVAFLEKTFRHLRVHSKDGSIHFLFMDWRHSREMIEAMRGYDEFKNLIVWKKPNAGMGSFYRSQHELIYVMKNGTKPHINNFGLGEKGRYRTNVWEYAGQNSWGKNRASELQMHPTVKPMTMIADAMKDCSKKNGIILDPFSGSGTTIMAAEATDRRARVIELDPIYVDVAIRRWETDTGGKAVHGETGRTFEEMKKERAI